jgi:hypothetical protein
MLCFLSFQEQGHLKELSISGCEKPEKSTTIEIAAGQTHHETQIAHELL